MLRGQIDVMVRLINGLVIADYKTDAVTEKTIDERIDFYRPQVLAYCRAMSRITGLPVVDAQLVFFAVRRCVPVSVG
jgi:ATP-dependent helicase/nuclease subunit A